MTRIFSVLEDLFVAAAFAEAGVYVFPDAGLRDARSAIRERICRQAS